MEKKIATHLTKFECEIIGRARLRPSRRQPENLGTAGASSSREPAKNFSFDR
jgi:hypothetical protein